MNRRSIFHKSLLLLFLISFPFFLDLYKKGYASGGACDVGFGKRLAAVQEKAIRSFFLEKLPNFIEVDGVTCSGFIDATLVATFRISNGEAEQLVAELEASFLSVNLSRPRDKYLAKRRRLIGPPTHSTHVYELSGFPMFDIRTVSVTIPKDGKKISTVVFEGGDF